ncbi:hypothetical protein JXO52_02490 [bacterium]|nr:hypothetical protein [bacterium]
MLRDAWRAFRSAENYGEKRGRAMIFQAHLEEWLNRPELIRDLEPGPHEGAKGACFPEEIPEGTEMPFDRGGAAADAFFFATGGTMSRLFTQADLDAAPDLSRKYGYYIVTLYEKIYASPGETRNRFSSEEAVRRHIPSSAERPALTKDRYDLLMDAAGSPDPKRMFFVARYHRRQQALKAADRLAAAFGIRFLVARIAGWVDNH